MKKSVSALLAILALTVSAKEWKISLSPLTQKAQQVFFLDLAQVRPDSSTMRLTTPDGKKVPFSFDFLYGNPPPKATEYVKPKDGFYSKGIAPTAEKDFRRPGLVSFKSLPGVSSYIFSFRDGAKTVKSRPDLSVRAWWVELFADPLLLKQPVPPNYRPAGAISAANANGGGLRVKASEKGSYLFIYSSLWPKIDSRICGRDILVHMTMQTFASPISGRFIFTPLRSAVDQNRGVIFLGFDNLKPNTDYSLFAEGTVLNDPARFWLTPNLKRISLGIDNGEILLKQLRLQSAPCNAMVRLSYNSPFMLNPGENIRFKAANLNREIFQSMVFTDADGTRISGASAEDWSKNHKAVLTIRNSAGKTVQTAQGFSCKLASLPAGSYDVKLALTSKDGKIRIAEKAVKIKIAAGPQW